MCRLRLHLVLLVLALVLLLLALLLAVARMVLVLAHHPAIARMTLAQAATYTRPEPRRAALGASRPVLWLNIRWARRTRICNERQLHSLQSITTLQLTGSTRNST